MAGTMKAATQLTAAEDRELDLLVDELVQPWPEGPQREAERVAMKRSWLAADEELARVGWENLPTLAEVDARIQK